MQLRGAAARLVAGDESWAEVPAGPVLLTYPLFHVAGLTAMTAAHASGRTVALMYRWDLTQARTVVEREQVTELGGAPLVGKQVIEAAAADPDAFASLTSLGFGGSATPASYLAEVLDAFGGRVSPKTGYGSTETTSAVTTIAGREFFDHPDSVGRVLPGVEVKLVDDDWNELAGRGEIAFRGAQVCDGYLEGPDPAFRDGWYRTGDIAEIDDHGFLRIVGRTKDVIIRGGENVYSAEVEAALVHHPDVVEVGVVGVPHALLGEEVAAVVRVRPGCAVEPADLVAFARERLAAYKVPARVMLTDEELPRSATGKLVKASIASLLG
jgi:long-chain acyl-CoA synthetase